MKIVDAKVIVCSPGRNFVTLKLVTEDGTHGLGDATLNGRELSVASYLNDPKDAVTINAQFGQLPDGTNHVASTLINGVSKELTVNEVNSNYQKM